MVKIREFIHENPVSENEKEMIREGRELADENKRLIAQIESCIRVSDQERATGYAWMEKCDAAEKIEQLFREALNSIITKSFLTSLDSAHLAKQILEMVADAKVALGYYPSKG